MFKKRIAKVRLFPESAKCFSQYIIKLVGSLRTTSGKRIE